jgi:hypothetical protein
VGCVDVENVLPQEEYRFGISQVVDRYHIPVSGTIPEQSSTGTIHVEKISDRKYRVSRNGTGTGVFSWLSDHTLFRPLIITVLASEYMNYRLDVMFF